MSDDLPERPDLPAEPDRPQGLVGLIVWPFQVLVLGALRLAFGLMEGIIRALLSPLTGGATPPTGQPPPPADGSSGQDTDDHNSR